MPVPTIPKDPPIPLPSIRLPSVMNDGKILSWDTWDPSGRYAQYYPRAWDRAWGGSDPSGAALKLVQDYLAKLTELTGGGGGTGGDAPGSGLILSGPQFAATRSSIGSLVPDLAARGLGGASPEFMAGAVQENVGEGVGPQLRPNILELVRRYLSQGSQGWPTL